MLFFKDLTEAEYELFIIICRKLFLNNSSVFHIQYGNHDQSILISSPAASGDSITDLPDCYVAVMHHNKVMEGIRDTETFYKTEVYKQTGDLSGFSIYNS
jgi:hypothetical protein